MDDNLNVSCNENSGVIESVSLFGKELLNIEKPSDSEFYVNALPLKLRKLSKVGIIKDLKEENYSVKLKGERFVNQFTGWGLVLNRVMGERTNLKYNCFGINYWIRREQADATCPTPGPGGPVVEAPLWVDTFSLLNLNWKFWGEDTRMMFASSHSSGPVDEFGHSGYENGTPDNCKKFMQNMWRRIYPGVMVIHGGLYYNAKSEEWIAITCRRSNVGYILNIENAGQGISYDFTLHSEFKMGELLRMPEIKIYYGKTKDEMMCWLADYVGHYYQEPPKWVFKTIWREGLAWDNEPTWSQQADLWEGELDRNLYNGIKYCLVTNRPIKSGTLPLGYEPDPNHGPIEEFKQMCKRISKRNIPLIIWMSHSGLVPGATEIDDDWFIRGIDGGMNASWGNEDGGMFSINPGHPGYLEYTKKWIRFYIKECGAKGIFFDCLGWALPIDFKHREFMRYPGDTNLMTIRFIEEVYKCIKECDSEAILMGEGTTLDAPINVFSINSNPIRSIDNMGPRDFFLNLNKYSKKKFVIDQAGNMFPASGICMAMQEVEYERHDQYMKRLLEDKGGPEAFQYLHGNLSVIEDIIFVGDDIKKRVDVSLNGQWEDVCELIEEINGISIVKQGDGIFHNVPIGIYRMLRNNP